MNRLRLAITYLVATLVSILAISALPSSADAADIERPILTAPVLPAATPLDIQLAWTVGLLNGSANSLTDADVSAHVAPQLLAVLPAPVFKGTLLELGALGPFSLQGFTRPPTAQQGIALLSGVGGMQFVLPISVQVAAPNKITGLTLAPVPAPAGVIPHAFVPGADRDRYDGLVDIGGRQIFVSCSGFGTPTVVLESGLGDSAAPWFAVETAVADFTRVCSYDRSNTVSSASGPTAVPRPGSDAAADLSAVLQVAGIPGPYVMVGHSIGSNIIRLYEAEHPASVAGLVLVDPSHEEQDLRRQSLVDAQLFATLHAILSGNSEGIDLDTTAAQVRAARLRRALPEMPLIVVSAGVQDNASQYPKGWPMDAEGRLHSELQSDLARLIPEGRQVVAHLSKHYVHQSQPELVVDAIREAVMTARIYPSQTR